MELPYKYDDVHLQLTNVKKEKIFNNICLIMRLYATQRESS